MRLLFDQNLSPRLVNRMADVFPSAQHVAAVGLATALDLEVWEYARQHGYVLVTKDADFTELSTLLGSPPKIVWLQVGNCTTASIELLLRAHRDTLLDFVGEPTLRVLRLR